MKWRFESIGDVVLVNPKLESSDRPDPTEAVSFVPMAAVSAETLCIEDEVERPFSEVAKGYTPFKRGDVLIAKITPCFENGKMALANDLAHDLGFGTTEFHVLRPLEGILGSYLFHMLREPYVRKSGAMKMKGAAGQRRVPADFFASLKIPLPPLAEQKRIAGILDAADALRAKRRETIEQLDTLLQSTFLEMFGDPVANPMGWKVKSLGELCDVLTGFAFPSRDFLTKNSGQALCRGINIGIGEIDWKARADWNLDIAPKMEKFRLEIDDIVLAMDRPWISGGLKIATVTERDLPSLLVQRVSRIRCSDQATRVLVYTLINSPAFARHCNTTETTVPHISPKDIDRFPIFQPPHTLQERFATISLAVQKQRVELQNHLNELDVLFFALQSCAFRGEL